MTTRSEYQDSVRKPYIGNTVYNGLRRVVEYVMPASATLYFTLAQIWGLPNVEEVVGTITAFTLFLAVCLGLSRNAYDKSDEKYDGEMVVDESDPERDMFTLDVKQDLETLPKQKEVRFKVVKPGKDAN